MEIILTIIGFVLTSSGKWSLQRGRGGKRTKDGALHYTIGVLLIALGLIRLFGVSGFIFFSVLALIFKTPLGLIIRDKSRKIYNQFLATGASHLG